MHGEGASRRGFGEAPLRVVVARKELDVVASLLQGEGGIDDEALGSSCARREESGWLCGEEEEEKGRVSSLSQSACLRRLADHRGCMVPASPP